jgi:hypothetical protein
LRKVLITGALAALACVALAATSAASPSAFFSAIGKIKAAHPVSSHQFAIRGDLVQPGNRSHRLGTFKALFNRNNRGRAVAYFPDGKLKLDGHGNHLRIIGGTRHWEGADGHADVQSLSKKTFRITFDVDPAPAKTH